MRRGKAWRVRLSEFQVPCSRVMGLYVLGCRVSGFKCSGYSFSGFAVQGGLRCRVLGFRVWGLRLANPDPGLGSPSPKSY